MPSFRATGFRSPVTRVAPSAATADNGLARRESVRKLSPEVQDLLEHASFAAEAEHKLSGFWRNSGRGWPNSVWTFQADKTRLIVRAVIQKNLVRDVHQR